MTEKERQFFSVDETLVAIQSAIQQYPLSFHLLSNLWRLLFGEHCYLQPKAGSLKIWAKLPNQKSLALLSVDHLKDRLLLQLQRSVPSLEILSEISALVFGTRVFAGQARATVSEPGLWIHMDMAGFTCTRCGHCCRTLDYRDGATLSDYEVWKRAGRQDVLDRVGLVRRQGSAVACQIWIEPGSSEFAKTCPWLVKRPHRNEHICKIYDFRPSVCRNYPGSRKHVRLTGCKGVYK